MISLAFDFLSQFCSNCTRWAANILSVLLPHGPIDWVLEEYCKLPKTTDEALPSVCIQCVTDHAPYPAE